MAMRGQVESEEPRPISTSRQPVFRARVPKIRVEQLHPAAAVRGLIAANIERDDLGTAKPPAKPISSMARSRKPRRVLRSSVSHMAKRLPAARLPFTPAAVHGRCKYRPARCDFAIPSVQRLAALGRSSQPAPIAAAAKIAAVMAIRPDAELLGWWVGG